MPEATRLSATRPAPSRNATDGRDGYAAPTYSYGVSQKWCSPVSYDSCRRGAINVIMSSRVDECLAAEELGKAEAEMWDKNQPASDMFKDFKTLVYPGRFAIIVVAELVAFYFAARIQSLVVRALVWIPLGVLIGLVTGRWAARRPPSADRE
jgi:hypothetical protein